MSIAWQQWGNNENAEEQLLLIHGWAMNSSIWMDIAVSLAASYPDKLIRAVDLPGYGYSAACSPPEYSSTVLAETLQPLLDNKKTTIIAWSMGGLIAIDLLASQELARQENTIEKLVLVSSSPCFVQKEDWLYAVQAKLFRDFQQGINEDYQATIKRFLSIQAMGSHTLRADIKTLQQRLFVRGEPNLKALQEGLMLLINEDKRAQLKEISSIPISLISGTKDSLIPYQGQQQLAEQKNITLFSLDNAGHAPFISHPEEFKHILQEVI